MRAIKAKRMRANAFLLSLFLLLSCSFGCAPPPPQGDGTADSSTTEIPEITQEIINERINDTGVWQVPEENGNGEPTSWRFDDDEPKEIAVVEKKLDGVRATIVLDIKTRSSLRSREPRYLAGQIRTEWELKTGWALRKWEIVSIENISMKYKKLPKPPAENSNR